MSDHAERLEHDLLGVRAVPADAYYGIQTARGLENFNISGVQLRLYPDLSDQTVTMAAEAGQLQLNVFEPVIAACIFEAQTMFINAVRTLRLQCVDGITANPDVCQHYVDFSIGTVTALNPLIGYDGATELAAEAARTGRGVLELVREKRILSEAQIAEVFDPMAMTGQRPPS